MRSEPPGPRLEPSAAEVRRCPRCGEAAVILVHDWKHTVQGIATGQSTRELRCQACGAWHRIGSRIDRIAGLVVGVMAGLTIVGLPLFFFYWRRYRAEARLPVMPGAPRPVLRFPSGPPPRTCTACGAPATVFAVTRHTHNGLPSGTDYDYRCLSCGAEFRVQSVWGLVLGFVVTLVMVAVAAAFVAFARSPGWRWGGAAVSAALALLLVWQAVSEVRKRWQHRAIALPEGYAPTSPDP